MIVPKKIVYVYPYRVVMVVLACGTACGGGVFWSSKGDMIRGEKENTSLKDPLRIPWHSPLKGRVSAIINTFE